MNKVQLNIVMDVYVSDDYLEKLKNQLFLEILKHCFKNNHKTLISNSMKIIDEKGV